VKQSSSKVLVAVVGVMLFAIVVLPSLANTVPTYETAVSEPVATPAAPVATPEPSSTTSNVECRRVDSRVCVYLEDYWVTTQQESGFARWQLTEDYGAGAAIPDFFMSPSILVLDATPYKQVERALSEWRDALKIELLADTSQDGPTVGQRLIGEDLTPVDFAIDLAIIASEDGESVAFCQFAAIKPTESAQTAFIVQLTLPIEIVDYNQFTDAEKDVFFENLFSSFDELINSRLQFVVGS
jgi:hypothetical protein